MEASAADSVLFRVKDTKADYKLWQSLMILTNQVTGEWQGHSLQVNIKKCRGEQPLYLALIPGWA